MPKWATPGKLAKAIDPNTVQTPALDLVDEAIVWAHSTPGARLIVSMSPQEGKSERLTKTGSLWALTRNPDTRVGIVSYSQALAETFSRDIRNRIAANNGDEGTLDLGLRVAADYGSAKRWQLAGHRGGCVAAGVGSSLTGRALDMLVLDDPIADAEQAASEYYRDRVWDWWQSVGSTRLAPDAPVCVVLTRWHEDDVAGRLLAAEDGHRWRVINIPALADHKPELGQSDQLGREPGEWLLSARGRTPAQWEQIRIQAGSRVFASLYQGRPSPDQGNVWQRQWWRRYREPLWSQHPDSPDAYIVRDVDEVVMSWDMTFSDSRGSDFVAGQVLARRGADVFVLDQVHKRLSFTDTLLAFQALVKRWPQANRKIIEDKANGPAVVSSLKSKIPGIVTHTPKGSKYARATAVAPFIEAGNVLLPSAEIALFDAGALIDQAAAFPNDVHDDQVDALSQALAELLLDGNGAAAWIAWAKAKAEAATRDAPDLAAAAHRARLANPGPDLAKCRKPDCDRLVSAGAAYCCVPCTEAAAGRYEIRAHSGGCDERAAERGVPVALAEPEAPLSPAEQLRQARNEMFRQQRGR